MIQLLNRKLKFEWTRISDYGNRLVFEVPLVFLDFCECFDSSSDRFLLQEVQSNKQEALISM